MKIAIVGGGLSGLSCVFRLERLGFDGDIDIYEKKEGMGVGNVWVELISEVFHRPIDNYFEYIYKNYHLKLEPVQRITNSINYGPNRSSHSKGISAYVVTRGGHPLALEKQIYNQINTKVRFNSYINVDDIRHKYDVIVIATGNLSDIPEAVGVRIDRYANFYMAMAKGDFKKDTIKFWLNDNYSLKGYGYMLPISNERAEVALVTPKRDFNLKSGWNLFIKEVWNDNLEIEELHEVRNVALGEPSRYTYENMYFAGLCGGVVTPAMGYGLHMAILSGFYIADSILLGKDYSQLLTNHKKEYKWSLALRNKLESLDNDKYDVLIDSLDGVIGRNIIKDKGVNALKPLGKILTLKDDENGFYHNSGEILRFKEKALYKKDNH